MTAKEYFESARDAAREMECARSMIEMLRAKEGLHAHGSGGAPTGISDPMASTDKRIDAELSIQRGRLDDAASVLDDAWDVVGGIEAGLGGKYAQAVSCHYLWLMTWDDVGDLMSYHGDSARHMAEQALEWVDAVGLAHAREGRGVAEI